MFDVNAICKDDRKLKSLTGLSLKEFNKLLERFKEFIDLKIPRGIKPVLESAKDKLFFILYYLKCYPTMDVAASIYDVDRAQISRWVSSLKPVLEKALNIEEVLPKRYVKSCLEFRKLFPQTREVFLDGTEREINRPKKNQEEYYSGGH